jgi:hypothetical protein
MNRFVFTLLAFILISCGSQSSASDCFKQYWDGEVGTCIPSGWRIVDKQTMQERGVPDDALVAFQSDEPVSGQFLTVTVTKEQLREVVEPTLYSQANVRLVAALPGYELVDAATTTIDGEKVDVHIFNAKPIADESSRRFYQLSTVANGIGYSITGTSPINIEDATEKAILTIVQNLTFNDPSVAAE